VTETAAGQPSSSTTHDEPTTESDTDTEAIAETDRDRLKSLMDSIKDEGLGDLKDELWDVDDFRFEFGDSPPRNKTEVMVPSNDDVVPSNHPTPDPSRSTLISDSSLTSKGKAKGGENSTGMCRLPLLALF
jgi:hypothetical protein